MRLPEQTPRSPRHVDGRSRRASSHTSKRSVQMPTVDTSQVVEYPSAPRSLEESGLSLDLMIHLVLKTLHLAGELTGGELAQRLGVRFQVVEPAVSMLKLERHCE